MGITLQAKRTGGSGSKIKVFPKELLIAKRKSRPNDEEADLARTPALMVLCANGSLIDTEEVERKEPECVGEIGMTPKALKVQYDPDVDILTLWNGTPASNGVDIAEDLMVFLDEEDEPQIVVLENAAELLGPYLFPKCAGSSPPTTTLAAGDEREGFAL